MSPTPLQPMSARQSWSLFLGLGTVGFILLTLGTPVVAPIVGLSGESALKALNFLFFVVLATTGIGVLKREGASFAAGSLKARLRLRNISGKDWLLVVVGVLVVDASYIGLMSLGEPLAGLLPDWMSAPYRSNAESDPSGDYLGLLVFSVMILFNIFSEEFLWRGCLLPRQELRHGRRTWWIHGVQWTLFHWFQLWHLPAILPGALVYGWLSTRTKSMVPGLVLHFGLNGLGIIMMAGRVFG